MAAKIVAVFHLAEFAETGPPQAERQNSPFGEINASLLFVLSGIAQRVVADEIQDCRHTAGDVLRFVENCSGFETRDNFVAELADAVAVASFDDFGLHEVRSGMYPFLGPAVKRDVVKNMFAELLHLHSP